MWTLSLWLDLTHYLPDTLLAIVFSPKQASVLVVMRLQPQSLAQQQQQKQQEFCMQQLQKHT